MSKNSYTITARVGKDVYDLVQRHCKAQGGNKSDVLRNAVMQYNSTAVTKKYTDGGVMDLNEVDVSSEDEKMLMSIGVGVGVGMIGYKATKWLRERYSDNENDWIDVMGGVALGLVSGLLMYNKITKK